MAGDSDNDLLPFMKTRKVTKAVARWCTDSNPYNPGWVVDVEFEDGKCESFPPYPGIYHAGKDADLNAVVSATLEWEGLTL